MLYVRPPYYHSAASLHIVLPSSKQPAFCPCQLSYNNLVVCLRKQPGQSAAVRNIHYVCQCCLSVCLQVPASISNTPYVITIIIIVIINITVFTIRELAAHIWAYMRDYQVSRVAVVICATLVNIHTDSFDRLYY